MIGWIALMFAAGIILILAEFLLPGGVLGVAGAVLLVAVAGMAIAYYPGYAIFIIVAEITGVAISIGLGMYLMANTDLGKSLRLDKDMAVEAGYINQESDASLLGKTGEVMTALRPAGTIIVDGKRIDAVSDGAFITKGETVVITEVHGNRVVVEKSA